VSIERFHGFFTPVCDYCEARLPAGESFMEAVDIRKQAGWKSRKDKHGDWEDMCPECQEAERNGTL